MGLVADRAPASTYDQALWRLVYLLAVAGEEPRVGDAPSLGMILLADVFWLSPHRVQADVLRYWRRIG